MNQTDAQTGLAAFDLDLEHGLWDIARPNWEHVIVHARRLTLSHTPGRGARSLDLLHIATARELAVTEFLTFDSNQRWIAAAEGFATPV